jgi:hypothetical protein
MFSVYSEGNIMKSPQLFWLLAAMVAQAWATGAQAAAPNPAEVKATVPTVEYVSPFKDYKPFNEIKIAPWKLANDLTHQIGGWRAYLKEANQPDVTEPSLVKEKPVAPPAPKPQAPDPHSGHKH